jgi:hypothetical protein
MLYLIPIILGIWNGLVILWDQASTPGDRKNYRDGWHSLGIINRGLPMLALFTTLIPGWFAKVLNPVLLLGGTEVYLGILSFGIYFLMSWGGYELPMNLVRGLKWDYVEPGKSKNFVWRTQYVIAGLLVIWAIWGNQLVLAC